ncbi:MAG: hypothetical protein HY903_21755 [Deltaproteobacteria bacterium]|nr:hypothetical protein [Deltaproteobacteria bacterium]
MVYTYVLGPGESPTVALRGTEPVVSWVRQGTATRSHLVLQGTAPASRCEHPELRDDGLSLHLAVTSSSALVVWDEDRPVAPGVVGGTILGQRLGLGPGATECPPGRALSPLSQDAADPVAVALDGGGFAVFWLAQRDLEASQANDTSTEVYGLALDGEGAPRGAPVRLTRSPGHRFGLVARARGGALWLAWRSSPESDNESRGDGGTVEVLRLDPALQRVPDAVTATPPGAVPTGAVGLTTSGEGSEVWWTDRRGLGRFRRALDATGALAGEPREEPVLAERDAELPAARRGDEVFSALRAGGRGAGVLRLRCPVR